MLFAKQISLAPGQKSPPLYFFCTMRIHTVPTAIPIRSTATAPKAKPSESPKRPTIPLIKKLAVKVNIALPKALPYAALSVTLVLSRQ